MHFGKYIAHGWFIMHVSGVCDGLASYYPVSVVWVGSKKNIEYSGVGNSESVFGGTRFIYVLPSVGKK